MSTGEAMRHTEDQQFLGTTMFHQMPWAAFDELARGEIRAEAVRQLRRAERSRRLLLLRALLDEATKAPELSEHLPPPEEAWDLLARVEARAPAAFDLVLAHPYTGSWAGYTIRLLRRGITGVCPLWVHVGYMNAIAAAAGIHAGLNFRISVPVWEGGVILPTLGLARLQVDEPYAMAEVHSDCGRIEVTHGNDRVVLPDLLDADAPGWWGVRRVTATATATAVRRRFVIRLDDLDPYRGLHEPRLPERLDEAEVNVWRDLLADAWQSVNHHLPELAEAFPAGLDSIVPAPSIPFRNPSASTGEAFGSALVGRPDDAVDLASTLVHEFQHIVLGGVLHLTRLYEDDPSERFYAPWRPDPRPLSGALQGVYAFFGVAAFWREVARTRTGPLARRAMFEFARSRSQTWRVLTALRGDATLTSAGHRFVEGMASRLGPWQDEPVPDDLRQLADIITADHYASWRMRHLRPDPSTVATLAQAWLAGHSRPPAVLPSTDPVPTPVQDGAPSRARADLVRVSVTAANHQELAAAWRSLPDESVADLAYAAGRFSDAAQGYRMELAKDPDRVSAWVGLGLALGALGTDPAARALTQHPEWVRAVRRHIMSTSLNVPTPERLAAWLGQCVP